MRPSSNHVLAKENGPIFLIGQQSPARLPRQVWPHWACTVAHLMQRTDHYPERWVGLKRKVPKCLLLPGAFLDMLAYLSEWIQVLRRLGGSEYEVFHSCRYPTTPHAAPWPNPFPACPPCRLFSLSLAVPGWKSVDMDTCTLSVNLHGGGCYRYSRILILLYYSRPLVSLPFSLQKISFPIPTLFPLRRAVHFFTQSSLTVLPDYTFRLQIL